MLDLTYKGWCQIMKMKLAAPLQNSTIRKNFKEKIHFEIFSQKQNFFVSRNDGGLAGEDPPKAEQTQPSISYAKMCSSQK